MTEASIPVSLLHSKALDWRERARRLEGAHVSAKALKDALLLTAEAMHLMADELDQLCKEWPEVTSGKGD